MKKQKMQLEPLGGSKFAQFKENEITDAMQVLGGATEGTIKSITRDRDCFNGTSAKSNTKDYSEGTCD